MLAGAPGDPAALVRALAPALRGVKDLLGFERVYATLVKPFVSCAQPTTCLEAMAESAGAWSKTRPGVVGEDRRQETEVRLPGDVTLSFRTLAGEGWPVHVDVWVGLDKAHSLSLVTPRHALAMIVAPERTWPLFSGRAPHWRAAFLSGLSQLGGAAWSMAFQLKVGGNRYEVAWTASACVSADEGDDVYVEMLVRPYWWSWPSEPERIARWALRCPFRRGTASCAMPGDVIEAARRHSAAFVHGVVGDGDDFMRMVFDLFPAGQFTGLHVEDFYVREAATLWRCTVKSTAPRFEEMAYAPSVVFRRLDDGMLEAGIKFEGAEVPDFWAGIRWGPRTPLQLAEVLSAYWPETAGSVRPVRA